MLGYSALCDIFFVRVFYFVVRLQFSYSKFGLGNIPSYLEVFKDASLWKKFQHKDEHFRAGCVSNFQKIVALDEGERTERILIVSFLRNSLSRVLWTNPRGSIVMPCDFRFWAPFWTGWLAGWLSGTNSLDLVCKCFLGRLELKTTIFFPHNQYNKKKLLLEIERTLLIFDYY